MAAERNFVLRTMQLLMVGDIVIGVALVGIGLFVVDFPALVIVGGFLACMGLGLFVLFRILSGRASGESPGRRQSPHRLPR